MTRHQVLTMVAFLGVTGGTARADPPDPIPYVSIQIETDRYGENLRRLNRGRTGASRPPAVPAALPPLFAALPPRGGSLALPYASTPELRRAVVEDYVAGIMRTNPGAAAAVGTQLAKHDYSGVFATITAPFGLRPGDVADVLAAYVLLGWLVAAGAPDPNPAQVAGARTQLAAGLAAQAAGDAPLDRARLAEQLKLQFVILHAGWMAALKEGTLPAYSNAVTAKILNQSGLNLRAVRLTAAGFEPR